MEIPHYIEQILRERKITDFLSERNIVPVKEYPDKICYRCPLHEGDSDPSFFVYLNSDYQSYCCFGCHSGVNIIHLVKEMDNLTIKQAIKKLIKGMDIDQEDILECIIKDLYNSQLGEDNKVIEELLLKINVRCYKHLKKINFDQQEFSLFEKFFEKIDRLVRDKNDKKLLEEILDLITEKVIPFRVKKHLEKEERKLISGEIVN